MPNLSWPWMKGVPSSIHNPIDPVDAEDRRPAVQDLIAENRALIDQVHRELSSSCPYYQPQTKHDDLWKLRFVLTHKPKMKAAVQSAKIALRYRHEYQLDERDIRACPPQNFAQAPNHSLRRYFEAGVAEDGIRFTVPDPKRGVIVFVRASSIDPHKMAKQVDDESWQQALEYMSEWSFQWCDYVSRTTGRFTKVVRLVDASDISVSYINRESQKREAKAVRSLVECYPQLLQKLYICNPPSWVNYSWKVFKVMLPHKLVEKIDFINAKRHGQTKICRYIDKDKLPERFGGTNGQWPAEFPTPIGCAQ